MEQHTPSQLRPAAPVDKLLTLPEVRAVVSLSSATLYRMIERGDFPPPLKIGRSSRWLASEIHAFVEAQKAARGQDAIAGANS